MRQLFGSMYEGDDVVPYTILDGAMFCVFGLLAAVLTAIIPTKRSDRSPRT